MWKMSICRNSRWRQMDRQASSLCNAFWKTGPSPSGVVIYLSICSVLRGEEWGDGRGFPLPEGAGRLLRDRKYNWVAFTLGYGTNQTFLPLSPTHAACRHSWGDEAVLAFQALSGDNPKQDLSLVLTVAFIWSEEVFLPFLPPPCPSLCILPLPLPLARAVMLETWMQLG